MITQNCVKNPATTALRTSALDQFGGLADRAAVTVSNETADARKSGFVGRIVRSRAVAQSLFGLRFPRLEHKEYYFDVTTPILIKKAASQIAAHHRVVDMGAGSVAVVGLSLWKRTGCKVISVDVNPELVWSARMSIARNNAPIEVVQSSFLDNVTGPIDFVVFNPPYVPAQRGEEKNLPEDFRSQWDGGDDGSKVIAKFLDAVRADGRSFTTFMGVNRKHVAASLLTPLVLKRQLELLELYCHPVVPVDVYVIRTGSR